MHLFLRYNILNMTPLLLKEECQYKGTKISTNSSSAPSSPDYGTVVHLLYVLPPNWHLLGESLRLTCFKKPILLIVGQHSSYIQGLCDKSTKLPKHVDQHITKNSGYLAIDDLASGSRGSHFTKWLLADYKLAILLVYQGKLTDIFTTTDYPCMAQMYRLIRLCYYRL